MMPINEQSVKITYSITLLKYNPSFCINIIASVPFRKLKPAVGNDINGTLSNSIARIASILVKKS